MTPARTEPAGEVVDLFCGVGAFSHGLRQAGFDIRAGHDTDDRCRHAFERGNAATFFARDVTELSPDEVIGHFSGSRPTVLAGCAPCQPFSTYMQRYGDDPRWSLVESFARLAVEVRPDVVAMENVPALARHRGGRVFRALTETLRGAGYAVEWTVARCEDFGVPQLRRRLVLLASRRRSPVPLAAVARPNPKPVTVAEAIGALPALRAGEADPDDPLHAASALSPLNLARIRASRPGGTWRDWPEELRAKCHRRPNGQSYPSVYGRMRWDEPAPTITTQCHGYGNGRFGHPEQDRAISLREAAILQTFPADWRFLPDGERPQFQEVGRWIGNAVPVRLGRAVGEQIVRTLQAA